MTTTPPDDVQKVAALLSDARLAMLTTIEADGTLISRPMAMQETEFDGDLWFFCEHDSRKVRQIAANPSVNVTTTTSSSWVSLTGKAVEVDDVAKKHELWDATVGAWFPGGPEDPNVRLLKVEAESAEYWDSPGGRVATLASFVKAKVTGEPYDGGENEKVDLSQ